ncbi:MAG: class I SAM-dependent methyltransferase [Hyphomicrobiaceae bacterium]|nr:class I SAM-dependent methyltransferase [Hyphomicrobiaceae bacterium]
MTVHSAASKGFSEGADAYARGRPDYPPALVDWLARELGLGPGKHALDLGSGTGKFLPILRATGAALIAVEPVAAMRAKLVEAHPDVAALDSTAQALPVADAALDAIVCATSFHWFASARVLAEMRRALKPGGSLGLVWNVRDQSVPWVRAITELIAPYEAGTPRRHTDDWRHPFATGLFTPLRETTFPWHHQGPAERVIVDRTCSTSFIAALPAAERAQVAAGLRRLIAQTPELSGGGDVAYPYVTHAYAARRA